MANPTITAPPLTPAPPAPPPEPVIVHAGGISRTNALMLTGAGAALATGVCLLFAAHGDASDADAARSYEDYTRISDRSDRLYVGSIVAAGAGIALGAIAIYRIKFSNEGTQVSIRPHSGGGALVLERAW